MFQKFQRSLFHTVLQRAGISRQVEAARGLVVVSAILRERFGEDVSVHVRPRSIKNRIVVIEVAHPAISEEMVRQEEALISEINNRLGFPAVVDISFVLPRREEPQG